MRTVRAISALVVAMGTLVLVWMMSAALVRAAEGSAWEAPGRAARKPNPVAMSPTSIAVGKTVYTKECQACHGTGGKGDGPAGAFLTPKPSDLTNAKVWEQSDGALFWKITEGRKPMPSYEKTLTDEQRWSVINYMRSTFAPKSSAPAPQK